MRTCLLLLALSGCAAPASTEYYQVCSMRFVQKVFSEDLGTIYITQESCKVVQPTGLDKETP